MRGNGGRVPVTGLTADEVATRVRNHDINDVPAAPTRTVADILRANLLTPFNALLGGLLAVILVVGPIQDALFGVVLVANALVGIVQELRAKRSLDHLALLSAPRARILRDGKIAEHDLGEVVLDDVLQLQPGDQVVVDGIVLESAELEIDESLLTGESDPVSKNGGDEVLSGSFVAAGSGLYQATRVGAKAYATELAEDARRFSLVHSELRSGINRVIKLVGWAMLPTAALLLYSQLDAHAGVKAALRGTVAGVVAMVPEGLVLLTSVAFALGVVRLARRRTLVQELPAVETLARVDIICLDKTGTITYGDLGVTELRLLAGEGNERAALGALVSADPTPNATLLAIGAAFPRSEPWIVTDAVHFSSARKWSGAAFEGRGSWVLGAPDVLLPRLSSAADVDSLQRAVEHETTSGHRVLLLARADERMAQESLPQLEPRALVLLADRVRDDAEETLRYFAEQGVGVKIISGDHPRTVAAVASRAGVKNAHKAVDARTIGEDDDDFATALETYTVFGRVTPHQKRQMVQALQRQRHVVAMTGDGVNDVLALKDADIGIAMGSGAPASRAVAKLVLLDASFAVLPHVVAEGRRVINNVERVANLFLTKTVYSMLLAMATGIFALPFPFLPRHLTLVGSLTIGVPGFLLALAPNRDLAHSGFVHRVLRFAVPAGVFGAIATFIAYYESRDMAQVSIAESKTAATIALVVYGLLVLWYISNPLGTKRIPLVGGMAACLVLAITVPLFTDFFRLDPPPLTLFVLTLVSVAVAFEVMLLLQHALPGAQRVLHERLETRTGWLPR
ncbi:MAG: HAD-IC family P-type ATPase [Actinomycetota bacterium]|nr:HAD-IC family P-type ATPase [Actinomycetota bacterium]